MNNQDQILVLRDNARAELMEIKSIEGGIDYLHKVQSIETWVKAEKKDAELQNLIAEQKLRTQRILGELIKEGQGAGEIATQAIHKSSVPQGDTAPKNISEIGLSRKQSSTFKQIADIPGADFENYVTEKKTDSELTTKGAVDFSKKLNKKKLTPMEEALLANKYGQQADRQKVLLAMARDVNNNTRSMEERRFVCARIKTESKI